MCGIVAVHGLTNDTLGARMLARIAHRGPDGGGAVRVERTWLGHRRLSIVDLEGGAQPIGDDTGLWLVGNGEIYNHLQIRRNLKHRTWRTASDNEAILHQLSENGGLGLADLEGMFAFIVAGPGGFVAAARDPMGIKPLYWAKIGQSVLFASEMKAFDRDHREFVEPFPPGFYWSINAGLIRFSDLLRNTQMPDRALDVGEEYIEECVRKIQQKLVASVETQMMGDAPIGVLLSGGLDSSIVAAVAARWEARRGRRLSTFAVGVEGSPDLIAARDVAIYLDTDHQERVVSASDARLAVPSVVNAIEHYDPTLVRSSVANYILSSLASKFVKVVLTGEGADELFAGYEYLQGIDDLAQLENALLTALRTLHTLNLQRCDRTTMQFGLEARVPFLDTSFVRFALSLPLALRRPGFRDFEKYLLRRAFEGWLPDGVLWRKKVQFGDGSGMSDVLKPYSEYGSGLEGIHASSRSKPLMRTREEAAYFLLWEGSFRGISHAQLDRSITT